MGRVGRDSWLPDDLDLEEEREKRDFLVTGEELRSAEEATEAAVAADEAEADVAAASSMASRFRSSSR